MPVEAAAGRVSFDRAERSIQFGLAAQPSQVVLAVAHGPGVRQMPLADHRRLVTGVFEQLGDRRHIGGERLAVALQPDLVRILPGKQRSPRRAATREVVRLRESNATLGQTVKVWRLDLPAETAKIAESQIVGHHHDHVRLAPVSRSDRSRRPNQQTGGSTVNPSNRVHNEAISNSAVPLARRG